MDTLKQSLFITSAQQATNEGMQRAVDFTDRKENNPYSQALLAYNSEKINKQCKRVLELLILGVRLTVRDAMLHYGIGDLRRRVKDLKDIAHVDIQSNTLPGGFKEYFIVKQTD